MPKHKFWVCGRLGKANSPPQKGIKKFRDNHSVFGRRRKQAHVFKHPPPWKKSNAP
jgi:hypothetical protein